PRSRLGVVLDLHALVCSFSCRHVSHTNNDVYPLVVSVGRPYKQVPPMDVCTLHSQPHAVTRIVLLPPTPPHRRLRRSPQDGADHLVPDSRRLDPTTS